MQRPGETWEELLLHSKTFQNFQKNDSTEVRLRVGVGAEVANMQTGDTSWVSVYLHRVTPGNNHAHPPLAEWPVNQ